MGLAGFFDTNKLYLPTYLEREISDVLIPSLIGRNSSVSGLLLLRHENGPEPRQEKRETISFPASVQAHFQGGARRSPGTGLRT